MSGHKPNYPQQLSAQCPGVARNYTNAGRPFTKADLKPGPLQDNYESYNRSCDWSSADNTTQDYSQQMCPKQYSAEGRPFNPALDISGNHLAKSKDKCPKEYSSEGRAFNPALDISRNRYQNKQASQRDNRLNLEYEMARNKEIALGRLRAEQASARAANPRPPLNYERQSISCYKPQIQATSKGKEFDMRAEIQRQKTAETSNICGRPGRGYINQGRHIDVDRAYDYNLPAYSPAGMAGRPLDLQRDLTFRRKNLPTPKQQRASSCPTPVQYALPHSTVQRVPRICPRPTQSVNNSPIRSFSPSEVSRAATYMQQTPTESPGIPAKYPITPVCRPIRTPVYACGENSINSPGAIRKTVTTTTTTATGLPPPQTPICPSPQQPANSSLEPFSDKSSKSRRDQSSRVDSSRQMDSVYGQTPPRGFAVRTPIKTPGPPLNVTQEQSIQRSFQKSYDSAGPYSPEVNKTQMESIQQERSMAVKNKSLFNKTKTIPAPPPLPPSDTNSLHCRDLSRNYHSMDQSGRGQISTIGRSFNQTCNYDDQTYDMEEDYRPLTSTICPSPMQRRSPQKYQGPTPESYYYNASMFNEPSQYKKRQLESTEKSFVDLTDETQYECDMDISGPQIISRSECPLKQEDSRLMQSWRIPPEDLTCHECMGYDTYSSKQPDFSSTFVTTKNNTFGDVDFDATEYRELPLPLKSQEPSQPLSRTCPPCEKPKASLFRCLAEKLSSTYDFISSFVTPEKSTPALTLPVDQTSVQPFGGNTPFSKTCPNNTTTFNLKNLYATQCPNATTMGLNTLFGNKTQLMEESASIRECANAKRCGRVQFDSSDKSQVQDPQRSAIRQAEIENLVNDTYCPGIIQETIDGRENFNDYSFNMSLSPDTKDASRCEEPSIEDPMTLLEAFSIRIDKERSEINKDFTGEGTKEQIEESIHKYFANQNPSDLNRSIKSLLISEHLQDYEQVIESKGTSLEAEVQKLITTFPDNAKVKLICYTGHTRPTKDETG